MIRVASIDIGTNTVRLLIIETESRWKLTPSRSSKGDYPIG